MSAEKRVGHPVLEAQSVLLDLGGMAKRSGKTKDQAKGGLHETKV
jgi:hypothetical protein